MATANFNIIKYTISLGHAFPVVWNGTLLNYQGLISCLGSKKHTLLIYFLHQGSAVPSPSYNLQTKKGAIFLPFKDMPMYVDMLRNEKPISGYMDSINPEKIHIRTFTEPVGEGE